jgi:uncharacterized protein YejL (UPF0352 family)
VERIAMAKILVSEKGRERIVECINALWEALPPKHKTPEQIQVEKRLFTDTVIAWLDEHAVGIRYTTAILIFYWYYLSLDCTTFISLNRYEKYLVPLLRKLEIPPLLINTKDLETAKTVFPKGSCNTLGRVITTIWDFYEKYPQFNSIPKPLVEALIKILFQRKDIIDEGVRTDPFAAAVLWHLTNLLGIPAPTQDLLDSNEGINPVSFRGFRDKLIPKLPQNLGEYLNLVNPALLSEVQASIGAMRQTREEAIIISREQKAAEKLESKISRYRQIAIKGLARVRHLNQYTEEKVEPLLNDMTNLLTKTKNSDLKSSLQHLYDLLTQAINRKALEEIEGELKNYNEVLQAIISKLRAQLQEMEETLFQSG